MIMTAKIKLTTNACGQVITEPCYDAELISISWDGLRKTLEAVFHCPKTHVLKLVFRDVVQFKIDGLGVYNISTTFFVASGKSFDHDIAAQYLCDIFLDKGVDSSAKLPNIKEKISRALISCDCGSQVLFANDAAAGGIITILSKSLDAEFL